ncbi:MAG: DNA primase [Acidimicrobiales bacterium]|jgi:DNA primase|nr:DNA primase [Acidimicrobiales bacterium]HJM00012.1 DNA primase [Acidimicrobiales bacterium]
MGIHDEDLQRVKVESDLAGIVSQYVALRKVGQRFSGLCPFHNEKTPSFSVNAEEGFFYCFGCQKSGDAITFVREIEHLDFVGAVEWLANRMGISLRYTDASDGTARKERQELSELLEKAAEFYHQTLRTGKGAGKARSYLRSRGFDSETVEQFRIGYAPDQWDALASHLNVPTEKLEAAGLGRPGPRGGPIDFFRDRVMFPVADANGVVVGFGGRMMPDGQQPKYKNTAKTRLYDKSKVLYGLHWAKKQIVAEDEIIVCEGYTDVIGCFRAGLDRAVATCGTALTDDHVKTMVRFAKRIVIAFDADGAGKAAADRFYEWEDRHNAEVFVAAIPDGADPGQLAEENPEALQEAIRSAEPFLSYRINRVLDRSDLNRAEGRARAAADTGAIIAEHPNEVVRDQYLVETAQKVRVDIEQMRRLIVKPAPTPNRAPVPQRGDQEHDEPSQTAPPRETPQVEVNLLRALVHDPAIVKPLALQAMFADPVAIEAFQLVTTDGWRDRMGDCSETVTALIARLLVEEVTGDPVELVSRALDALIGRWNTELRYDVNDIEQLRQHQPIVQWLAQRQEEMHSDETRSAAVEAVVDWLRNQETTDQSS